MHLEHVNLSVRELERSIDFYRRALGLELRWRGKTAAGRPAAHVGDEHCYLALFEAESQQPAPPIDYAAAGFNHLAFVVDDLEASKACLADLEVQPHFEADYAPGRRLYFMDPDGIEVELIAYTSPAEALTVRGELP